MMATTKDAITETRHLTRAFTTEEKEAMMQEMFSEQDAIGEKECELDAYKKQVQAEISQHEATIGVLKNKLRTGYEKIPVQCIVKYDGGKAKYYRKDTGEFVDERPMSDHEQMNLAGGFTDAEQIIRADSEKQMEKDAEEPVGGEK
jgi:hypothetical protein